jgi:prepilin-type processing-associated H-X9-DG protein
VQINAIDRRTPGSGSQSNYAFVDGHVGTLQFEDVYRNMQENKFDPDLN